MTGPADRIVGWWLEGRLAIFPDGWRIHHRRRRNVDPEWLPLEVVDTDAATYITARTAGLDANDETRTRLARQAAARRLIHAHQAEHGGLLREELEARNLLARQRRRNRRTPAA